MNESTKAHWLARMKEWAGVDETAELTVDDLRHMAEVAKHWHLDEIQRAHESYGVQMEMLHELAAEAGLLKDWLKPTPYRVPEHKDMVELRPPEIDKSQS